MCHFPNEREFTLKYLSTRLLSVFILLPLALSAAFAQEQKRAPQSTPAEVKAGQSSNPPAANPADVASIDSIVAAVYDVISGPAGKKRDWNRMRSLFIDGARLIPTGARQTGGFGSRVLTVEDYIERSGPFLEGQGFFEREIARRTETYGQIAHVFSTYDSKHKIDDPKPFARGINSFQLMNDGTRWWVVTIFWQGETEKAPLPEKYLKTP
jgi:hypothetical protein